MSTHYTIRIPRYVLPMMSATLAIVVFCGDLVVGISTGSLIDWPAWLQLVWIGMIALFSVADCIREANKAQAEKEAHAKEPKP